MSGEFRELLAGEKLVKIFSFGRLLHPVAIEILGQTGGFDGFWLDQEHAGLSTEQIALAALSGRAAGLPCFVRMPFLHYSLVNQALESGVDGVMAARVQSAAEAAEFVRWSKFAPLGLRGVNPGGVDGDYGTKPFDQFVAEANRDQMVAIQIETAPSVEDAEAIAALAEVDLLFVGTSDLSQELGVAGQHHHAKVWEAIDQVSAVCRQHGKAWGSVAVDPQFADKAVDRGCKLLSFGADNQAVRLGFEATQKMFGKYFSM